jgi:nucleoside-diphosphate-sugar epimerase
MTARIGVTGSTGVVGGGVARGLAEAGIATRLIVRSAARAPELPGAEVAVAAYGDHADSAAALAGIQTLFMVSAAEHPDRRAQHLDFVDAAAAAGVQRIVYTSFFGASPESTSCSGATTGSPRSGSEPPACISRCCGTTCTPISCHCSAATTACCADLPTTDGSLRSPARTSSTLR